MPPRQIYSAPPIAEAIIDIATAEDARLALDLSWLDAAEYPVRAPMVQATVQLNQEPARFNQKHMGLLVESADHKNRIQVRHNGLSVHRLPPYTSWEDQGAQLRRHWTSYRRVMGPHQIQRLGVRYINRIKLPETIDDVGVYVLTLPAVADGIGPSLNSIFMRLEIPYPNHQAAVLLTEVVAREGQDNILILDIDAVRSTPLEENQLWSALDELHNLANEVFERSITDAARRLFQ